MTEQMSIFDYAIGHTIKEPLRITKPVRLIELFAGCEDAYRKYEENKE